MQLLPVCLSVCRFLSFVCLCLSLFLNLHFNSQPQHHRFQKRNVWQTALLSTASGLSLPLLGYFISPSPHLTCKGHPSFLDCTVVKLAVHYRVLNKLSQTILAPFTDKHKTDFKKKERMKEIARKKRETEYVIYRQFQRW